MPSKKSSKDNKKPGASRRKRSPNGPTQSARSAATDAFLSVPSAVAEGFLSEPSAVADGLTPETTASASHLQLPPTGGGTDSAAALSNQAETRAVASVQVPCHISDKVNENRVSFIREKVCKNLSTNKYSDGKYYCLLHLPTADKNSNEFIKVIKQRVSSVRSSKSDGYEFSFVWFTSISFKEEVFDKSVRFNNAVFSEDVNFLCAKFKQPVSFNDVKFLSDANFTSAEFLHAHFNGASFDGKANFEDAKFLWKTSFEDTKFKVATFKSVKFGGIEHPVLSQDSTTSFSRARFENDLDFSSANFLGFADFDTARFLGDAIFSSAVFSDHANFSLTVFSGNADINSATFSGYANFSYTIFCGYANFKSTTFSGDAYLNSAAFAGRTDFESAKFLKVGNFEETRFLSTARFSKTAFLETSEIFFRQTKFCGHVIFWHTSFEGFVNFEGEPGNPVFLNKDGVREARDEQKKRFEDKKVELARQGIEFRIPDAFIGDTNYDTFPKKEAILDLQSARLKNPERISFHTVRLRPNWFVNTDTRKMVFTDVDWENGLGSLDYVNTEITNLTRREVTENPERLSRIAFRQLAHNAEENNRYEEASAFRRMAMETEKLERKGKRKIWSDEMGNVLSEKTSCLGFFPNLRCKLAEIWKKIKDYPYGAIQFLYRWSSYYGESWSWALLMLLLVAILPIFFYLTPFATFERERPIGEVVQAQQESKPIEPKEIFQGLPLRDAIPFSLATTAFLRPDPRPSDWLTKIFVFFHSILGPLQAALLALAIRRKFMR